MTGSTLPRGLRNRNPLNLRRTGQRWRGMDEVQDDREFVRFQTMAWGFRAAYVTLRTYVNLRGADTLRKAITRWAPDADGNDSTAYLAQVSALSGIGPDDKLDPECPDQMVQLVMAMSRVENGQPAALADALHGWALYMT